MVPTDDDLLEAEVVRDLVSLGMEHVPVAVPHLLVLQSLTLLNDLPERRQGRLEVNDADDPAGAAVVELVAHLPGRVAAEERLLAQLGGEVPQRGFDRVVELADRLELVVLRKSLVLGGPLDLHEHLDRLG